MNKALISVAAAACLTAGATHAADDDVSVYLVQGTDVAASSDPARIYYESSSGKSKTTIDAALVTNGIKLPVLSRPGRFASELVFVTSIAKDNQHDEPYDQRALATAIETTWSLTGNDTVFSKLGFEIARDNINDDHSRTLLLDIGWMPRAAPEKKKRGLRIGDSSTRFKPYFFGGYASRRVSAASEPAALPNGNYGLAYLGLDFTWSIGTVSTEAKWVERFSVALTAMRFRDTKAPAGYARAADNYAEVGLSYALFASEKAPWKPSIAITRKVGTHRLANLPYEATTGIALQVSYGI